MKVKVNWKELGKQLWDAVKPVLLAAIGISTGRRPLLLQTLVSCGIVSVATGCSSLSQTPRGQTTEIIAVGIPAIAWVSHTSQEADHSGSDTNGVSQANTSDVDVPVSATLTP